MSDWTDEVKVMLSVLLLLALVGCCANPTPVGTPVLEVRDDGGWRMDECTWCCPMLPLNPDAGYSCTQLGCVKELPK